MLRLIIKELAEQKGISQSRLQREAGVTMPILRRYWTNNTDSVHLESMDKIARALGVQVRDLFAPDASMRWEIQLSLFGWPMMPRGEVSRCSL
jgi:transcriptional regulator with XRE-family HTH domain